MNTPDARFPIAATAADFLRDVRRSGVVDEARCDEIDAKLATGALPEDPRTLAGRLVGDEVLTEYQARRILVGRFRGLVVARYILLDRIGSGGMGQVFRARHSMMGRTVAIKFLSNRHAESKERIARFRREMQLVGLLDHPNIVRAFDADELDGVPYIVMEFVPGLTLDALLQARGKLSVAEVLWYGAHAARGLEHAHRQGVVHRDVKPSNILLSRDRQVKLLDLGLGTLLDRDPEDDCKTEAGATVGTMDYLSPEQACMKPVDGRSDIYSLGCTLFHLMSGRLPFEGDSSMERMATRIVGRSIPLAQVLPELPERIGIALDRMLARDPGDRYQTAGEVADVLMRLVRPRTNDADGPAPAPVADAVARSAAVASAPSQSRVIPPAPAPAPPPPVVARARVEPAAPALDPPRPDRSAAPPPRQAAAPAGTDAPRAGSFRVARPVLLGAAALLLAVVGAGSFAYWSGSPTSSVGVGLAPVVSPAPAPPPVPPVVASPAVVAPSGPGPVAPAPSADLLARQGRWGEAAAAYGPAIATQPGDLSLIHRRAITLIRAGDLDGYRRLRAEKLAEFQGQDNPGAIDVIRASCLTPGGLTAVDWAVELARKASRRDPKAAWRLYILGLTEFRAGQDAEAVRHLDESIAVDPFWGGSALNWPVLAMAHSRLGHANDARNWLDKARRQHGLARSGDETAVPPWYDAAEFEILLKEAESLGTPGA